jgi:hypothetical protein
MTKFSVLLFAALLSGTIVTIYSCQREVDGTIIVPKPSSKDPAKLSASLKVWHGTRTNGTAPASNGTTPSIDPTLNPTVKAFAGRYAIIKPEITSGDVAGYYVTVDGSGQYFNLDFSKPRNIAGRTIRPKRQNSLMRVQTGNADSSIVIVLPPNIQVPDTFCITYSPYDALGNIGPAVTTCVIVTSLGASTNNGWLQNEFRLTASWDLTGGVRTNLDTILYNRWDAEYGGYFCDATSTPPTLMGGATALGFPPLVFDSILYIKGNLRFAINGAFDYKDQEVEKNIDAASSTCTSFIFNLYPYSDTTTGAYNYDPVRNSLVLIWEFDEQGVPDPDLWEYEVTKINDNHFILRDPVDNYYIRFER